ncbi:poly polymerase catalytic domain-containing protein [Aspergillus karnatakaensis]|uniref:putative poly(ADP)-ribose polymerase PARP n=1 Tax=Aspergillus karnatakaensis TaxID=1810916 RepID=UPI003CCD9B7B
MPPRSFKKLVIAVSGTFPGYKQGAFPPYVFFWSQLRSYILHAGSELTRYTQPAADLKAIVERHGATFVSSVTADCTHLVTTQKEVEKNGTKYQQASAKNCEIVSIDWLVDSDKAKKPVAEKSYHFTAAPNGNQTDSASAKPEKKRSAKAALDAKDDDSNKKPKKEDTPDNVVEDAQRVTSEKVNKMKVEVDEAYYPNGAEWQAPTVYIDESGLIWDATLNQTVAAANNNKFYRVQLLTSKDGSKHQIWTRWGRVGENGQSAHLGDGTLDSAKMFFEKKFKDKSGLAWKDRLKSPKNNKYTFIERNYEESDNEDEKVDSKLSKGPSKTIESKLPAAVRNLVSFIFNQEYFLSTMAQMSYDAKKLPLGKLSKRTLMTGFETLKELSELATTPSLAASRYGVNLQTAMEQLSNRYFTTIPHVFGRNRPPVLNDQAYIKKEVELLETLTDMEVANSIMKDSSKAEDENPIDRQYQGLGMQEMTPLEHSSTEFQELQNYLTQSRGSTHHLSYKVIDIFRIERQGEFDRFKSSSYASMKNSDRRLLWHGSRSTNYGGILSQGLRIAPPEAPVSGYMFGKGVYFADMSSKSANYCNSWNSGNKGLLLLGDVELGDPLYELYNSDYHAGDNAKKEGKIATLGKGRTIPGGWKDAGCVHPDLQGIQMPDAASGPAQHPGNKAGLQYNEYIVYDVAQIRLRYLFFVDMR